MCTKIFWLLPITNSTYVYTLLTLVVIHKFTVSIKNRSKHKLKLCMLHIIAY